MEDEPEENDTGSRYIVLPIVFEILMAAVLFFKSRAAAFQYLYFLIPLLLAASLIGTRIYNRNGDMKMFSAIMTLWTTGCALQVYIDQVYEPITTFSLIKFLGAFVIGLFFTYFYNGIRRILNTSGMAYIMIGISAAVYILLYARGTDPNGYGTRAWMQFGNTTVQLTDFTKVTALMFYASLFSSSISHSDSQVLLLSTVFLAVNLAGALAIRELGSFFILFCLHLSILYIFMNHGRAKRICLSVIFLAMVSALGITFLLYRSFLPAHDAGTMNSLETLMWPLVQKVHDRFSVAADIQSDPLGAGYQLVQGKKALWLGGLFGNTIHFNALPVAESDMAYPALVASFGHFIGILAILLFLRLMIHGCELSRRLLETSRQDGVVVFGASLLLFLQAMIVILGSCNIIPFTGLPIPFLSRGGTYQAITMCLCGTLLKMSEEGGETDDDESDEPGSEETDTDR